MEEYSGHGKYEFSGRVRYSEIDHRGTMTLPALINYFQDCSIFQSEAIGLGTGRLRQDRKAWVLSYWQVIVDRYPGLGEKVTTGTFATEFKGLYGYRNFYMKDETGEQIARANSIWVFMDLEKGRPVRPTAEHIEPYGTCEPLEMPYEDRKIVLPETGVEEEPFPVRKYHIDTNEHVNNCQYVQMALEMVSGDIRVRQLRADYKKSALLGDMIYPKLSVEAERTVAELCDKDGKLYAIVEMK
nr:acyl-ACP thioesterase domain-containing protein [uncultured Mediterraneibacter sp.]